MVDWAQILHEHGQTVWKTIYRLTRNEADAGDYFQETFIAAWHRSQRETIHSWRAFLVHVATMNAFACLRKRQRQRLSATPVDYNTMVDSKALLPDEALIQLEQAEGFRRSLATLPLQTAMVFCLAFFDELSYSEIATVCSISESYVGVLYHRAKLELRKSLTCGQRQKKLAI